MKKKTELLLEMASFLVESDPTHKNSHTENIKAAAKEIYKEEIKRAESEPLSLPDLVNKLLREMGMNQTKTK